MTRMLSVLLVAVALALAPACHKAPPNLTPAAHAAFNADQVVQRIGELQDTAIALNHATPQGLKDADAVLVVTFTVSALKTIQHTPDGWRPTVLAAYAELKQNLPPPARQSLSTIFLTVDTVLASLPK